MVITKEQHLELKQLKNDLTVLLSRIENNKIEDLLTFEDVLNYASDLFDISTDILKGDSRKRDVIICKYFIIKFAKDELKLPYQKIADYLNRTHAAILNNYNRFGWQMQREEETKRQYEQFKIDLL